MFAFASELFSRYFSKYDKIVDINKDVSNQGFLERYMNGGIGTELDANLLPYIENMLTNIYGSKTMFDRMIPMLEKHFGINFTISDGSNTLMQRRVLRYITRIYDHKGLAIGYTDLFAWLGMTAIITEYVNDVGFDSPVTFDDTYRRFDSSSCNQCSDYSITITYGSAVTATLLDLISNIIYFNEPIVARLRGLTVDGNPATIIYPNHITTFKHRFQIGAVVGGGGTVSTL